MGTDPLRTRGAGAAQVFDAQLEPAAEQERLNRVFKPKVPDSLSARRATGVLGEPLFLAAFFEHGDRLLEALGIPKNVPVPTRDVVVADDVFQPMMELTRTAKPFVGFCLWLVQVLVKQRWEEVRKRREFLSALLAGISVERGLADAEKKAIKHTAFLELRSIGLSDDQAQIGSQRILELLLATIPQR